jgi:hypothetical protein
MTAVAAGVLAPVSAAGAAPAAAPSAVVVPAADPTPTPTPTPAPVPAAKLPLHRGDVGPLVRTLQTRLNYLGAGLAVTGTLDKPTMRAVIAFRVKYFLGKNNVMSKDAMKRLVALTYMKNRVPKQCRDERMVVCVDKTQKLLRVVKNGKVVYTVDARMGGSSTPTREGAFRVFSKSRYHVSSLYKTPMPWAMFFSGGQAVHYSPFFHVEGYYGASHGCVGVRSTKVAAQLWRMVPVGTKVYVYRS